MQGLIRAGAIASFLLSLQFAGTLLWILLSWPPTGLAGLMDAMADTFVAQAQFPTSFFLINLYNASFAASAVVAAVAVREQVPEMRYLPQFGIIAITIAGALFLASGVIPLVKGSEIAKSNDLSALRAIVAVVTGLVLAATMASGAGLIVMASAMLRSGRGPRVLWYICIADGVMQLFEFMTPPFLILDPLTGMIWSTWLGTLFWRGGFAPGKTVPISGSP